MKLLYAVFKIKSKITVFVALLGLAMSFSETAAFDQGVLNASGSLTLGSSAFLGYTGAKWITNTVTVARNKLKKKDKEKELQTFLQENHSLLLHDFASAEGALFREIAIALKLSETEYKSLKFSLEGSEEQLTILRSLDSGKGNQQGEQQGKISLEQTREFSIAFTAVLDRSLGSSRMLELFPEND